MFPELFAGGGIGLLLGYLLGLSVDPVTKTVIVAITGALGVILGWQRGEGPDRTWRLGAFGIMCAVGATAGMAVRAGSVFTPGVRGEVAAWESAGFDHKSALAFVAYERLGVKPDGVTMTAPPAAATQQASVLYASDTKSLCGQLVLLDTKDRLQLMRARGGAYKALADTAALFPDTEDATISAALRCNG
jgi:hypothetical protein